MSKKKLLGAACVFTAVLAMAYPAMIRGLPEQIDRLRLREIALVDEYARKKNYAVNLDLYREQLREIDTTFGALLHALPNQIEHPIELVVLAIGRHRLRLQTFGIYSWEGKRDWHVERVIQLNFTGRYHDVAAFLAETTTLAGTLRIDVLTVNRTDRDNVHFIGDLRMHRYLSDAEIAAKPKGKAGQPKTNDPHAMRVLFACLAANCAPEPADLPQELAKRTKDLHKRIDPLPIFKPPPVVTYQARNFADPFYPRASAER